MFIKGKIENCTMINDCKDLNVITFPYGMLKALLGALNTNFKGFTRSGFIVNSPSTFSVLYGAVSFMMDEAQRSKMTITSESTAPTLTEMVAPHQLQQKFGGTVPDKTENFWPPSMPSDDFGYVEEEQENNQEERKEEAL